VNSVLVTDRAIYWHEM